ncbi:MAG: phosphatase PAP2 family protein [Mucilaginibacter sp.]
MEKNESRLKGLLTWRVFLTGSLVLAALLLFVYIADEAVIEGEKAFDDAVISFFDSVTGPRLIGLAKVFTFLGSPTCLVPFYLCLVAFYFVRRNWLFGVYVLIITASSTALFAGLKLVFHRARPDHPVIKGVTGYSFPSGHSLSAFVFSSILIYIVWHSGFRRRWKWVLSVLLVLYACAIGSSRIVLKVHYPTDVLASFCVGLVWVVVSLWILQHFKAARAEVV